ncbi:TBC1 domain family member 25-like isoform X2 [Centruroides vittatus]|uniref:TBC1 domain family member 25-like isoform X2 n=1 Tax=Centruroides vittatus TaxID=120091 RepID=UPI00350F34D1
MAVWKKKCSFDGDDYVHIDLPNVEEVLSLNVCVQKKDPWHPDILHSSWEMLTKENFLRLFDKDGRIVDEHQLRRAIFRGGVDPSIRKEVWRFLYGLFPFHSTERERETLLVDYYLRYRARKYCCHKIISKVHGEDMIILNNADVNDDNLNEELSRITSNKNFVENNKQKLECLKLLAKLEAEKQMVDLDNLIKDIKIIKTDIVRTDRDHPYFSGDDNPHLDIARNILILFSAFHPHIGYTQGMNDILSRFLVVLDSEFEAYWCFVKYIENTQQDYHPDGMVKKLDTFCNLLEKIDPELYFFLIEAQIATQLFTRWFLVTFKRELEYNDALRLFEILSSRYLEMNSLETQRVKQFGEIAIKQAGRRIYYGEPINNSDLTFDLFVCLALLVVKRRCILLSKDGMVLGDLLCNIGKGVDLKTILNVASHLLFDYCRKSGMESFL